MNKKIFALIILFCSFLFSYATSIGAMTESEKQVLIAQIQAQIIQLQAQLFQIQSGDDTATLPLCTADNWIPVLSPAVCPSTGEQTKNWIKIGNCSGGITLSPQTIFCNPNANTCTSFAYSDWSLCSQTKVQTRKVLSSYPWRCEGGNPITSRECEITTTPICTSFSYSGWSACNQPETQTSGIQTRTIVSALPEGCEGGNPILSQACVSVSACTAENWTYSLYPLTCPSTGQQTKTWKKIGNCTGGLIHPVTETVACTPGTSVVTPANWCYTFAVNLILGNSGVDVKNLHIALEKEGYTIPSEEKSQSYFGVYTKAAVIKFQEKYASDILAVFKLKYGTGRVGVTTVAKLNKLYGCKTCTPNWSCGDWSQCVNGKQTRTCTDLNNCGNISSKPVEIQSCNINIVCPTDVKLCPDGSYIKRGLPNCEFLPCPSDTCTPNWSCGDWSQCVNGQQTRTCYDTNNCGTTTNKPGTTQACSTTCNPNWSCGDWSQCVNGRQTRTCTDLNNCVYGQTKIEDWQDCISFESGSDACQSDSIPGLNISCLYGLPPYNTDSHMEMNIIDMNSLIQSVGSAYYPKEACGCSWIGVTDSINQKLLCPISIPGCDFTKVPDQLPRITIKCDKLKIPGTSIFKTPNISWDLITEVNPVEWSSRLASGETYDDALQNTIENQKRIMLMSNERECIEEKVDEYYIGGESSTYPGWMLAGGKYRLNPNSPIADWQKWVNGAWTSDF